tara:strand:- start:2153 stop:2299 length:147 start_codon:yes stop_codon:yes gene_type:complete
MIGKVNVYLKSQLKQTTLEYIQKALLEQFKKKKCVVELKEKLKLAIAR